jgi:predicted O-methyltransferase YrrM
MNIHNILNKVFGNKNQTMMMPPITARKYIESVIEKLPLAPDRVSINIDHCVKCMEKIPGILHPLEGFTLFLLSMTAPTDNMIVEVGSYLGRSTTYMALGSLISGKKGVYAVDMFPKCSDWYLGKDGYYHIKGSDYYLEERIYKDRARFFYSDNYYQSTLDIFRDIIVKIGLGDFIEPYKGSSADFVEQIRAPLRMVFIDGDHTYEGVIKDIVSLADMLTENGFLCFHDYSSSFPGVVRAVDEYVINSESYGDIYQVKDLLIARKKGHNE